MNSKKKPSKPSRFSSRKEVDGLGEESFQQIQNLKSKKAVLSKADFDKLGVELTTKQRELFKTIQSNTLTVVQGPAGTSKTFTACYTALSMLVDKKIDRIVITKPIVDAGESLGYLPGSIADKTFPYMKSYISTFEKILGKFLTEALMHSGVIEINLLAYMRGDTFDNSVMILDEAQNTMMSQLMLWATRLGKSSTAIMCGDVSQYDLKQRDAKFLNFIDICEGMKGVSNFKFEREDIVRNSFLIELTDRYEKWKYKDSGK